MADNYWRAQLADVEPTCFPDLTGQSPAARSQLSGFQQVERTVQLNESVSRPSATTLYLAACIKLLSLYTGDLDLCLHYLVDHTATTETCIHESARPLRLSFDRTTDNSEILCRVRKRLEEANDFGLPSQDVLKELSLPSSASLSTVLVLINENSAPNSVVELMCDDKYDIIIEFVNRDAEAQQSCLLKMHFRSSILMLNDTPHVLDALEESIIFVHHNPSSRFVFWNPNSKLRHSTSNLEYSIAKCSRGQLVHSAFEEHAMSRPNSIALDYLSEDSSRTKWTFSELNSIADSIASVLITDYDVQVEDSVPICVSKSPAFYACVLGVLKAGGTFTPFSGSPPDRQSFMLAELGSKVVLHTKGQDMSWCPGMKTLDITPLTQSHCDVDATQRPTPRPPTAPSNLCYQMYTSGSTGRPKAVSLEHRNAVQTACATRELVPWTSQSRILQQAGVTFDMCYFETFFAWTTGICLCSAPDTLIYNSLTDTINQMDVCLLGLTPSVALTLNPKEVPGIKWMYCIGEALPQSLVEPWEGRLVNSYGPTEAAQMVTLFPVDRNVKSSVIGTPFSNTSFVLLHNDSTDTVPILGIGELCIGGGQVARGYYKDEEKTKQRFIFQHGQRLYRTGDLVRLLGNGNFEFIGRVDDQVKVRGQRVELGEVDKAVQESHSAIDRACTQILKVTDKSKSQLVTFVVLKDYSENSDPKDIRCAIYNHLTSTLSPYMIPKIFIFIDRLPLSPSGKVNKRALTQALRESNEVKSAAPRVRNSDMSTGTTEMLQQIYSEFCGLPPNDVNPDASIYQLGIDSISAIQIAHILKRKGFRTQASHVLRYPSIEELSTFLDNVLRSAPETKSEDDAIFDFEGFDRERRREIISKHSIPGTRIASIRPASPLQSSMIMQTTQSSGQLYFNHLTYQLPQAFDVDRFLEAWDALVSTHEILRSGFVQLDIPEHPIAMVTYYARSLVLPVQVIWESTYDQSAQRARFMQSAAKKFHDPPWQVLISPRQNQFHFSAHHTLYDAQVLEVLLRDLALAYDGKRLPTSLSCEPHLARLLLAGGTQHESTEEFWRQHGTRATPSRFPVMNPLFDKNHGVCVVRRTSASSLLNLEKGCQTAEISLQAAAQMAWGYLLAALTGENVVTFGTILNGRVHEHSTDVSFPMITTVPTIVHSTAPCLENMRALMKFNANVQEHQFMPLNKIQKLMGFAGETLFDTIFTFQKPSHARINTETQFEFEDNTLTIEYPVSIELEASESGGLECSVFYQSDYMHSDQAMLLVDQYHFLLHQLIFGDDSTIRPVVGEADPHLFSITPAVHVSLPSERTLLHHSVEMTAQTHPTKTALQFVTEASTPQLEVLNWTFEQLNAEGNRLAHLIRQRGIKQGALVAICFDKCPEAAFAMLGISKAGCGLLALDPGAPIERKKFILQDSEASLLLSGGSAAEGLRSVSSDIVAILEPEDLNKYPTSAIHLDRPIDSQETAYCLYTSGTTGTPKGCLVTHENVIQVFMCFEKLYAYNDRSKWLQFASYHFDVSIMEHFWSWFVGITVVKASRDLILQDLSGMIDKLQITHIDLTPSLARLLAPEDVPSLAGGVFVTGGEMLRRDIIEAWGESGAIHNAYGPTEATIGVTMHRKVPKNGRPSNIGWPFDVVGILVTQPSDPTKPVIRGGIGELLVTGSLVANGYLRREELTRQRFIRVAEQKAYRTGDLVRILSDGSIDFLGRADDQVKLRGQRLEVGEINSVIKQSDENVDDVYTLVLTHPKQQKDQLVSFVSERKSENDEIELTLQTDLRAKDFILRLRNACAEKLPGYMIPTHVLLISKMPLSANNKVENRQLKALYDSTKLSVLQALVDDNREFSTSTDDMDVRKITAILSHILGDGDHEAQPSTNFFELGLDSISVISFCRALRAAGYKKASPSVVMKNPTIVRLASIFRGTDSSIPDGSVRAALQKISAYRHRYLSLARSSLSVKSEQIEAILPCTALQAGIISRSLESDRGLYFAAFSFNLNDDVDEEKLREACQSAHDQIQILRTKFVLTDDGFIQVVLHDTELPWIQQKAEDGKQLDHMLDRAYRKWWTSNKQQILRPFELVISTTPRGRVLSLHMFHALYDGNSLPLIMKAVIGEYHGQPGINYGPSYSEALPYGPLHEAKGATDFWVQHLSTLNQISLAKLRPLSPTKACEDTFVVHRMEPVRGLEDCRRRLNVTHQALVQTCWAALLQDTMSGPIILGMVVSGRSAGFDGMDSVIGPLFNTIPFLLPIGREDTWRSAIYKSHEFNTAALSYQHTPLRDVQKWTRKYHHTGPLFENLFVFQRQMPQQSSMNPPWTPRDEVVEADYPMSLEVEQTMDGGFNLTLACQAHISDEQASTELLRRLDRTIRLVCEDVELPVCMTGMSDITVDEHHLKFITNEPADGTIDQDSNGNGHSHYKDENGLAIDSSSDIMEKVKEQIASLADVSPKDIHGSTSIFELGLDSIDAVKLSSRLKRSVGVHLPVSQVMRLLTVNGIAASIEEKETLKDPEHDDHDLERTCTCIRNALAGAGLDLSSVEQVLPCTPLQEAMIADMTNSNFERYFNFDVLKLNETTDVSTLRRVWTKIIEMCPILRTRFVEVDDPAIDCTVAQIVMPAVSVRVKEIQAQTVDLTKLIADIRNDVRRTFDELPGSRFIVVLGQADPNARYLVLALPHAMYDGWSLGLIHDAIKRIYRGADVDFASYKPVLSNVLQSSNQSSLDFWRQTLAETKVTLLPLQREDNGIIHRSERISRMPLDAVHNFCKQIKVTVAALCQTIWSVVLAHHTRQLDVTFGQVQSGRTDETTNEVVFPTMNTVISRSVLHGNRSEMVQYVQETLRSVSEHQHFPMRKAIAITSSGSPGDVFNTLFIFQKSVKDDSVCGAELYTSVESASNVEYPVCVEAEVGLSGLIWRTACEDSYLSSSETENLLEMLDSVLETILKSPGSPIVEYIDNKMRLCGLPEIYLPTPQAVANGVSEQEDDFNDEEEEEWSTTEQKIRKIVADVAKLEVHEITKNSNLLSLGLDSISTIKVSSLLRKQELKISVNEILSAGSIRKMAEVCKGPVSDANGVKLLQDSSLTMLNGHQKHSQNGIMVDLDIETLLATESVDPENVEEILPATAGQMLLLSRWQNEGVYYSSLDFSVSGCNDVARLHSAWAALVQRSPMLRTIFIATGQRKNPIIQITLKSVKPSFTDVSSVSDLDEEANGKGGSDSESVRAPCALFAQKAGEDHYNLALKFCHALYDGFSIKMLIATYQDLINEPSLPKNSAANTFSSYLSEVASSGDKRTFWTDYLGGVKARSLPSSKAGLESTPVKQIHVVRTDMLQEMSAVRAFARRNQVSIQSLFLAGYSVTHAHMLREHCENDEIVNDVLVGVFMANRNSEFSEGLAAPTLSFTPVRVRRPFQRTLVEIARGIQNDMRDISEHGRSQVSLWELQDWLGKPIKVDVWINLLRQWLPDKADDNHNAAQVVTGEKSENIERQYEVRRFEDDVGNGLLLKNNAVRDAYDYPMMDLEATIKDDNLDISVQAPTTLFDFEGARRIIQDVSKRLNDLVSDVGKTNGHAHA